ncbi:hypothetical protein [Lysinibacillus capsici]|uniref:hypothetical protein n=1 Tax=Lysinibacillus capsici TaxID=2115968 RepID=UPI003081713A|nr:hypothetical protein ICJ70_22190 [Lysinibacillus capsici]
MKTQISTTYSKGSLVQSNIAAEDGTYPANGRHTDGFWYVKGEAVGPLGPGVIINKQYNLRGNESRRLIRLANGTLIATVQTYDAGNTHIFAYKSTDEGRTWTSLNNIYSRFNNGGNTSDMYWSIVALGNEFGIVAQAEYNKTVDFIRFTENGVTVKRTPIYGGNPSATLLCKGVSIAIDPQNQNFMYVAWSIKDNNSHNLFYSKTTDGGITWSAQEKLTSYNTAGQGYLYPSIVWVNGKPVIISYIESTVNSQYVIHCHYWDGSKWLSKNASPTDATTVALKKSAPSAVVDKNGVIHVTWDGPTPSSVKNNIHYISSADGGYTWTSYTALTNVSGLLLAVEPSITADKNNTLYIMYAGTDSQETTYRDIRLLKKQSGGNWIDTKIADEGVTLSNPSTLYDPSFKLSFGDTPPTMYRSSSGIKFVGTVSTNTAPSITLLSPENNLTLYENDTINISGDAYDADKDQSVTVFYQINGEQRKVLATNVSQTQITLSKQLTFKDGKLYDGETVLTGTLTEGVAHILKVWAVDSENGQSATIERTFYVVPNRAPLLSVDAVVPTGVIDSDKFKISGTSSDQDANSTVKVTKKVNAKNSVEIYSGPGGAWEFDVSLAELVVGENTIVIEVIDNYGAKTSKTIKLKKNEIKTPILHAVARYKITPPAGSAKGVLLFIERNEDMDLKVELSMTLAGEQEQYETLTADNTAPMPNTNGIVEDTFYFETTEPKDNIILKISTTRPDATVNHKIHLISGAVE